MSTKSSKSAKSAPTKAAASAPKAEEKKPAAKAAGPKIHIVWDNAGKGDAEATFANCEKAGFEVTMAKVSPLANYMKHEDRIYVPENLADGADKALAAIRSVRTQMTLHPTSEDDTIYAWIIR